MNEIKKIRTKQVDTHDSKRDKIFEGISINDKFLGIAGLKTELTEALKVGVYEFDHGSSGITVKKNGKTILFLNPKESKEFSKMLKKLIVVNNF